MTAARQIFRTQGFGSTETRSLGKPAAKFPAALATDSDLAIAVDRQQTTLAQPLDSVSATMTVTSAAGITAYNLLSIDSEIVKVTGAPTGNTVPIQRGFDGTTPATHLASAMVWGFIDAWHHNALVAEVEAIEQTLGVNLSAIPAMAQLITSAFNFPAQSPGGALVVGANSITLAPVPAGVNGTDVNHYLYVSGTGTAEAAKIIGGSAAAGAASGTLIIQCAYAHPAGWTIASCTSGIQEAVSQATAGNTATPPSIYIPGGYLAMTGPLNLPATKDLRIDSGNSILDFPVNTTMDGIVIDSCEDCDYRLPLIIYSGSANAVHFKPNAADPSGLKTIVDSRISIVDIGNRGPSYAGIGNALVLFDTTSGDISHNDFYIGGAGGAKYGALVTGTQFVDNMVELSDMHDCTIAQVQDNSGSSKNQWNVRLGAGSQGPSSIGASIYGNLSSWRLSLDGFQLNKGFVVQSGAANNAIYCAGMDGGYANHSTGYNRAYIADLRGSTGTGLGFAVTTPPMPGSGSPIANNNLTSVAITFSTAGTGATYSIYDPFGISQSATSPVTQGMQVYLAPSEGISISYATAPTWQWRGIP